MIFHQFLDYRQHARRAFSARTANRPIGVSPPDTGTKLAGRICPSSGDREPKLPPEMIEAKGRLPHAPGKGHSGQTSDDASHPSLDYAAGAFR